MTTIELLNELERVLRETPATELTVGQIKFLNRMENFLYYKLMREAFSVRTTK